jgi:membrane associated rhomboid family serine protease
MFRTLLVLRNIPKLSSSVGSSSSSLFLRNNVKLGKTATTTVFKRNLNTFRFRDTFESRNRILWAIIGGNVTVFLAWQYSQQNPRLRYYMNKYFTLSSRGFLHEHLYFTAITAAFSHKDLMHLLVNMLVFHSFGGGIIHTIGTLRFLYLYFGGGIASAMCQVFWPYLIPDSWPAKRNYYPYAPSLGASGAVNSLVAYSIMASPTALLYFFGVVPIPAFLFGLGFIGMDAIGLYYGDSGYGNAAHLGGAALGAVSFLVMKRPFFRRF